MARRGDEQVVHVRPAEGARCHVGNGQGDAIDDRARRRDIEHTGAAETCHPEMAAHIHGHTVRIALFRIQHEKHFLVCDRAVLRHVIGVNGPVCGIREIERMPVGGKCRAVGHRTDGIHMGPLTFRRQTIKGSCRCRFFVIHGTEPERAIGAGLAVIEAVVRQVRLGRGQGGDFGPRLVADGEGALIGADETAVPAGRETAQGFGQKIGRGLAGGPARPEQKRVLDVDPVDRVVLGHPDRTLTEPGAGITKAIGLFHGASSVGQGARESTEFSPGHKRSA